MVLYGSILISFVAIAARDFESKFRCKQFKQKMRLTQTIKIEMGAAHCKMVFKIYKILLILLSQFVMAQQ